MYEDTTKNYWKIKSISNFFLRKFLSILSRGHVVLYLGSAEKAEMSLKEKECKTLSQ